MCADASWCKDFCTKIWNNYILKYSPFSFHQPVEVLWSLIVLDLNEKKMVEFEFELKLLFLD